MVVRCGDDKATPPAQLGKEWKGFAGDVKATDLYFELSLLSR